MTNAEAAQNVRDAVDQLNVALDATAHLALNVRLYINERATVNVAEYDQDDPRAVADAALRHTPKLSVHISQINVMMCSDV